MTSDPVDGWVAWRTGWRIVTSDPVDGWVAWRKALRVGDERQDLLRMKARSFSAQAVGIVVLVGTMVAIALRDPIWPFALFGGVEVLAFFAGLAIFRGRDKEA